jgi:ribosomal protein S18 acetylase RimI-like enzyme
VSPQLITADRLSPAELLDAWNRGFTGYFVDNTMDEVRLEKHIRWSGVDLARSAILLVDDKPAAFSLAAMQDRGGHPVAWIAGFGVAPEHRRKGLAGTLMRAHCEILDKAGVRETFLEVIEENPARRVYSAAGFRELRTLHSFQGTPLAVTAAQCEPLELAALESLHARFNTRHPPVWRRSLPVLRRIIDDTPAAQLLAIPAGAGHAAYALVVPHGERLAIVDAAAAERESADRLVAGLGAAFPDLPMRIIDEPEGSPVAEALAGAGLVRFLSQFEMARTP